MLIYWTLASSTVFTLRLLADSPSLQDPYTFWFLYRRYGLPKSHLAIMSKSKRTSSTSAPKQVSLNQFAVARDLAHSPQSKRVDHKSTPQVWETSLATLQSWMEAEDTDPDLSSLLLAMLRSWRSDQTLSSSIPYGLSSFYQQQVELGDSALFSGWLAIEWESCQQAYLTFIHSRKPGKRWVTQIIKKLWNIAWDLWEHRNGILHIAGRVSKGVLT